MSARSRFAVAVVVFCASWAMPVANAGAAAACRGDTHQKCFVGDKLCVDDAFDLAEKMLSPNHWNWLRTRQCCWSPPAR